MAAIPPSPLQFAPPPPKGLDAWFPSFLRSLNQWMQQTAIALQSPPQTRFKVLSIATGAVAEESFPIVFNNPLDQAPGDVHVAKVIRRGASLLLGAVFVDWSMTSAGQIQVLDITGLDDASSYEVTLSIS